ncbi:HAD family phosphatase [Candidatus Synechococcus calcipolaris G9]|uniref:HAD family phosphatase n=1 Tax=Candidatus Synechococcus calcipolaris G9 TaxID=1497997 RepID=A0ABT6F0X9_9SYNE|nr:HAD family phosphatase [Candidatus Synechococcus calcipolaris]MDG2991463.1 HAD family phosphatase [Candidatus Synechococcus calcipolaris G9]
MPLKAVLFDFNGVIIDDENLHQELINEILLGENLRPQPEEYQQFCLGRSDRDCLDNLLRRRGRFITPDYLDKLIAQKTQAYQTRLGTIDPFPFFPGVKEFIHQLTQGGIVGAIVTGAIRQEVMIALERGQLKEFFGVIVTAEDVCQGKPDPEGYLLGVKRLQQIYPEMDIEVGDCLAIEDTFTGIEAAKKAGLAIVGIAHTYPFHMLQRRCNWAIDQFEALELDRVRQVWGAEPVSKSISGR